VYDELRKLAAARMALESPDHTLQPTALVHEAYLRLVGVADEAQMGLNQSNGSVNGSFAVTPAARRPTLAVEVGRAVRPPAA
jgi:hypothetical protein